MLRIATTTMILFTSIGLGCTKPAEAPAAPTGEAGAPVEVTAEGAEFDPAVGKDRIPAGAWYCDMGSVHYARGEKGDGVCPLCKMELVQKPGAAKAGEAKVDPPKPDTEQAADDHAHGEN